MRIIFWILIVSFAFLSCRKEALNSEISSVFVGEWRWAYTDYTIGFQAYPYDENDYKPVRLEILEKGVLKIYIDGKCKHRYRIVDIEENGEYSIISFDLRPKTEEGRIGFRFSNNGTSDIISTGVNSDFFDFVPPNYQSAHQQFISYFVRNE